MRAIELFSGVGGFRLGLERAGHQVIWSNEWDKYACDTYDYNFAEAGHLIDRRDITTVPADELPEHDIIVGGFPCQAFSIAGKRLGMDDPRGNLFFEIARIARTHRTKYLFLENVKGFLAMTKDGRLGQSSGRWMSWGMTASGMCLTAKTSVSPRTGSASSLSQILEDNPDPKYFLSPEKSAQLLSLKKTA